MVDAPSGARGYGGRDIRKVVHFLETSKPAPIAPKRLIRAVAERANALEKSLYPLTKTKPKEPFAR